MRCGPGGALMLDWHRYARSCRTSVRQLPPCCATWRCIVWHESDKLFAVEWPTRSAASGVHRTACVLTMGISISTDIIVWLAAAPSESLRGIALCGLLCIRHGVMQACRMWHVCRCVSVVSGGRAACPAHSLCAGVAVGLARVEFARVPFLSPGHHGGMVPAWYSC
jgi:hypothetical protein